MWDILNTLNSLLSPLTSLVYSYFGVTVAIIPQAVWDMSENEDIKKPISQSAALVVLNSSNYSVNIHEAGVRLQEGKEMSVDLVDLDLPIEIKPRDRVALVLTSDTFSRLAQHRFKNIKYFYVEDALFRRHKVRLSKRDIDNLLKIRYLRKVS